MHNPPGVISWGMVGFEGKPHSLESRCRIHSLRRTVWLGPTTNDPIQIASPPPRKCLQLAFVWQVLLPLYDFKASGSIGS